MSAASSSETTTANAAAAPSPKDAPTPTDSSVTKKAAAKEKKKKDKAKKKAKRSRKNTVKTKVVVRRLPPNLPEDAFMNAVKRWTGDDVVDYKIYVPGKFGQSKGKENVFSRAYFNMKSIEAVIAFHQNFDGHIFLDSRGNESRAVVEFAPFQKIPKEHKTKDARQGTIDNDPDYLKFLDSLKEEENKGTESKEIGDGMSHIERLENRLALVTAQTLAAEQANKPKTTPLLEHLRAQKAAQAAAKAKAQASKAAANKTILSKSASKQAKAASSSTSGETSKKSSRKDRAKKKKEKTGGGDSAAKAEKQGGGGKEQAKKSSSKSSGRSSKEGKSKKKKENEAEGSSSKSRQIHQQGKQQIVAILERQSNAKKAAE